MKKYLYHKLFSQLLYTWIFICLLLLSIIAQIYWLGILISQEYTMHQQQLKLVDFTYKTELVSHRLTDNIKIFSYTFNPESLGIYIQEFKKVKKIDDYILLLKNLQSSPYEIDLILQAKRLADSIREPELKAIKLMLLAYEVNEEVIPADIKSFQLTPQEQSLSKQEKINMAVKLLQSPSYINTKEKILNLIKQTRQAILNRTNQNIAEKHTEMDYLRISLMFSTIACLIIILWIIWFRRMTLKKWLS